jgi:hypothetical protein
MKGVVIIQNFFKKNSPCSAALISTAYQPWYSIFLSQQNSHSRLISRRNNLPNRVIIIESRPSPLALFDPVHYFIHFPMHHY